MSEYEQAQEDFDRAIEISEDNPKFWHSKGLAYVKQKEYENAIEMFKQALKISDSYVASYYHLGLMNHQTNRFN